MKELLHFHVRTELATSSISLALTKVKSPHEGNLMPDEEGKVEETGFEEENGKHFWNVDEADANKKKQALRNTESDASLSEEWIGTTRFKIQRTKLPKGCKLLNGGPHTNATDPSTRNDLVRRMVQIVKGTKGITRTLGRRPGQIARSLLKTNNGFAQKYYLNVISEARAKLEKCVGSTNAVYYHGAMIGNTRRYADFLLLSEN